MPKVSLITSLGCTPCLRVKRILTELQSDVPTLSVEELEYTSSTGSRLARENGILYPPAVFLNGVLIGHGKVDANAMTAKILAAAEMEH